MTESTRILLQRNIDRRVLVGDAYWDWIHNMSQFALRFNQFDVGNWFSNTAAYRHGMVNGTGRPSGNFISIRFADVSTRMMNSSANGISTGCCRLPTAAWLLITNNGAVPEMGMDAWAHNTLAGIGYSRSLPTR